MKAAILFWLVLGCCMAEPLAQFGRLVLKDGTVLISVAVHSVDDAGAWIIDGNGRGRYVKADNLPDHLQATLRPEIRAASVRRQNGLPVVTQKSEWAVVETKTGEVLNGPRLMRVDTEGIHVEVGGRIQFLSGSEMPNWMIPDVIDLVRAEQRRRAQPTAQLAPGTKGQLVVKGIKYEVNSLIEETPLGIKVLHGGGIAILRFADMEVADQEAFGYDPTLESRWGNLDAEERAVESAAWFKRRRDAWNAKGRE